MGEHRGIDSHGLRTVPEALAERYLDEGWWTDDSLGDLVAEGLAAREANIGGPGLSQSGLLCSLRFLCGQV